MLTTLDAQRAFGNDPRMMAAATASTTSTGSSGYDAIASRGKRRAPVARTRSEDLELTPTQRILLKSGIRNVHRNFAIARWAVSKHLDYVASFTFQADSGDDAFDDELEAFVAWWSRPENCDAARRLCLSKYLRMAECRRTIDGDVLINRLASGLMQGIEGDRLRTPGGGHAVQVQANGQKIVHGVLVNTLGAAMAYGVHRRSDRGDSLEFERWLSAAYADLHGYFDRFDQVRGISPMAAALNTLQDVYENFDYALAKAKVSQLFALAFYRDSSDQMGEVTDESTTDEDGESDGPKYAIDFGRGPVNLDLDPGDKAEVLESRTPSGEFQSFTTAMIAVALKALDIPYSFYDESHSTYNGQRQAWIQYDFSAEDKRADNKRLLDRWTEWRIRLAIRNGELRPPRSMPLNRIKWDWVSRGIPWIDPLKEVTADIAAIKSCLEGPESAVRRRGGNVYKNIDERARVESYAREKGVVLEYMMPPVPEDPPEESQQRTSKG